MLGITEFTQQELNFTSECITLCSSDDSSSSGSGTSSDKFYLGGLLYYMGFGVVGAGRRRKWFDFGRTDSN